MRKLRVAVMVLLICGLCSACGEKYTCRSCGEEVSEAYYDPFRTDSYLCRDCARAYFAPFPFESYRVK